MKGQSDEHHDKCTSVAAQHRMNRMASSLLLPAFLCCQIVDDLVKMILARSEADKNYGVVMLAEGLIEFIPEFNQLISDINDVLASGIPTTIGTTISAASLHVQESKRAQGTVRPHTHEQSTQHDDFIFIVLGVQPTALRTFTPTSIQDKCL